jgi:PAS domain S-box-containing protein
VRLRGIFRNVSPFAGAIATVAMLSLLLTTIYFTWVEVQWVTFLAGVLAAAVISIVSRASHAEWVIARRSAQLAQARAKVQSESVLRKHAEESLCAVRGNLHYLDEALPAMIAYVDAQETIRYHNRAFRTWTGLGRDAIDDRPAREILGAAAWTEIEAHCRQALGGRVAQFVRSHRIASGACFRLAAQCLPHYREDGQVAGIFLIHADVTDPLAEREGAPPPAPDRGREIYAETMADELTDWDNVADRLRAALDNDEFCLYAQAISPLSFVASRAPFHELLVRLREEEENLMPPGTFLPLAEQHGLLPALDRWVVSHLLDWAGASADRIDASYSVNVSGATMLDGEFPAFVKEEFRRRGLPGSLLCFEIAGSDAATHAKEVSAFIEGARAIGCHTVLCGFGKDLASFDVLKQLPVDYLKIDAGIVLRAGTSPVDAAKVKAIVRVAHDTRRKTIAECVEDEATIALLKKLGVDYAQGFGVSRPQPLGASAPPGAFAAGEAAAPVRTCAALH